ncbi:MAG TPA: ABC transporter ATP-binding protein [Armatimonadota bacterium]|jgi:ABC-2 type transport system ATP-binding protein
MLELMSLRKTYGALTAVDNLSFTLGPGDIFGFIGPNGAGKTTTIKMLSTLIPPTSGTATIDGIDVVQHPMEVRPLLGYMPDFFGLYDDIKVWEYLDFFAAAYRLPKVQRPAIIDSVLELTDLTEKREAFVQTLSRGMQQRLCLAKCLVHDPKVLLLDEPASGLDPRARIDIKALIAELGRMGKTVIVSSHILPELSDFCNKIGVIERGKLLVSGDVTSIVRQLQPARRLQIRTHGEVNGLRAAVEETPQVTKVAAEGDTLTVDYQGDLDGQVGMLRALVHAGHPILSFTETSMDLEDVFMQVTTGKVQ